MGRKREHGDETRQALMDVATGIVGREGVRALTVRRVADEAGTTTRAVYSIFGDKDGLIRALYEVAAETMRRYHEEVPVDPDDPTREFPPLALAYRAAALAHPYLYDLWFGQLDPTTMPTAADLERSARAFNRVADTVTRCVATGRFADRDPLDVSQQMFALVHGLASLELRGFFAPPCDPESYWRGAIGAAVRGYAT